MRIKELIRRRGSGYRLAFRTTSSSSNWCFNRFRLYTADDNVLVQARRPDGTILSTQKYRDTSYTWGANFEASFLFDLSYNTGGEEVEIYIKGLQPNMEFSQLYAYTGHAGSAVRWSEDANITEPISNAQLSYINMGLLKFDEDYDGSAVRGLNFVYLENNGISVMEGADQFYGGILDVRNNGLSGATIDQIIIGIDNKGRADGSLLYSGNAGTPTSASRTAYDNLIAKNWTITGTIPPLP